MVAVLVAVLCAPDTPKATPRGRPWIANALPRLLHPLIRPHPRCGEAGAEQVVAAGALAWAPAKHPRPPTASEVRSALYLTSDGKT